MRPARTQRPTILVEFFGVPQLLTQTRQIQISAATLRDVVQQLTAQFPVLVGSVLDPNTNWLLPGYIFVVDGRFTRELDYPLTNGARVLLVAAQAGGA